MSHHRYHSSAPAGIKVLAVVTAVDGLLSISRSLELLATGAVAIAGPLAISGVVSLALAYGLWQLEPYAYVLGLAIFGAGVLLDLLAGSLLGAVLSAPTLSMLYHYRGLFRD
jgi:hypothetical protein